MTYSLTAYERETIIHHRWGDDHATIETFSRKWAGQFRRTVAVHPGHAEVTVDTRSPFPRTEGWLPIGCVATRPARNTSKLNPVPPVGTPGIDDGFGESLGSFRQAGRDDMETRWLTNDEWSAGSDDNTGHWHVFTSEPALVTKLQRLADHYPDHVLVLTAASMDGEQVQAEARVASAFMSIRPSRKLRAVPPQEPAEAT